MKKIISFILICLTACSIIAQTVPSSGENYIYTKTFLSDPIIPGTPKISETVQYFDGLGRPSQLINVKASPLGKDLVTNISYDQFGRQVDSWLPAPMNSLNGAIQSGSNSAAQTFYGDNVAFSHSNFEASPLGRKLSEVQPGSDWQGHTAGDEYGSNNTDEVTRFTAIYNYTSSQTALSFTGAYEAGRLYKFTTTDEDGNTTIEFKNKERQTILIRKILNGGSADTYYIYNQYDQLSFVISPKASVVFKNLSPGASISSNDTTLNDLCYQYRYDGRNRLVEKKVPGKGWEYMVYDMQDRLVLSQDANLGINNQWLFTKYDAFGRTTYTGIYTSSQSYGSAGRNSEQVNVDAKNNNNTLRTLTVGFTDTSGMDLYYDNGTSNYPNNITKVLTVNYYDNYPSYSFNPSFPTNILGETVISESSSGTSLINTKNLPVLTLIKNIEDNNWTKNYVYYDNRGRIIGTHSINHLGGYTKTESLLDFTGLAKQTITRHKRLSTDTERVINQNYEYDSQNRLLVHKHQVDSNVEEILTQNTYNEISQVTNKKLGGVSTASPLQSIDYLYNIRGRVTKVNDPANLNGKLFGYEIKYNTPEYSNLGTGRYNGNISEVDWKNAVDNVLQRYTYSYDKQNQLTNAYYAEPNAGNPHNGNFDEYLTYDLNGNISNLIRKAVPVSGNTSTIVDNLDYQYSGNRLNQIIENAMNSTGYEGGNNTIDYDLNGNMTNMKDKGIQDIFYNHLNLPNTFFISQYNPSGVASNFDLNYVYRADGTKLRKTYNSTGPRGSTKTTNITDYLDGFQYSHSEVTQCLWCRTSFAYEERAYAKPLPGGGTPAFTLDFVITSQGFYSFRENRYIYQYKDQLGNARISFAKDSTGALEVTDKNDYYPLGLNHIGNGLGLLGSYFSYKYNGKELQETGMYDYGARFYMPDIGRWGVEDEKAEKYRSWSPYNYAINNPILYIDPDGKDIYSIDGGVRFTGWEAQIIWRSLQDNSTSTGGLNIKAFHFVPENLTPSIYKHTLDAFKKGKAEILHYDSDLTRRKERRKEAIGKYPTKAGMQRDEYPYASTFEGGKDALMAYVPSRENSIQGGMLGAMYRAGKLQTGDAFLVIPVPKDQEPEDVKQEALSRLAQPAPVVPAGPDFGRPVIPYKMWPVVAGAVVVLGAWYILRNVPVVP